MALIITPQDVVRRVSLLPAFPRIVSELMADLEDDSSSMMTLAQHVERDPVMTGRILSTANRMLRNEGWPEARDVYTAVSLIGFARIREIVLTTNMANFAEHFSSKHFHWGHGLAVGIAAQELAQHAGANQNCALVAGLLHDIGQLWLAHFHLLEFQQMRLQVEVHGEEVCAAERAMFGLDHCEIGRIVTECWQLPADIVAAVTHHHAPDDKVAREKMVAITHLAEMIAQSLDLPCREFNSIRRVSGVAARALGIDWNNDCSALFGAIDARYQYAAAIFS
ncbi:MAG: HDOD domain-containing protein [Zoogloeaceae bacterium]|jgi:HD-like signal output (HDOD) protein|nr:HDOD domain-containing protein [Zoogloeaceae bacterium]